MIHYYRYLFVKMKVFNYSELHFSEGTSYKIPTLMQCSNYIIINSTIIFHAGLRFHRKIGKVFKLVESSNS